MPQSNQGVAPIADLASSPFRCELGLEALKKVSGVPEFLPSKPVQVNPNIRDLDADAFNRKKDGIGARRSPDLSPEK